jgi:hypothetical protein
MTISADEFLRRFLIHILPKGMLRIRRFGLFANRKRSASLLRCRFLLKAAAPPSPPAASAKITCPICSKPMLVVERLSRHQLLSVPTIAPPGIVSIALDPPCLPPLSTRSAQAVLTYATHPRAHSYRNSLRTGPLQLPNRSLRSSLRNIPCLQDSAELSKRRRHSRDRAFKSHSHSLHPPRHRLPSNALSELPRQSAAGPASCAGQP